MRAVADNDILLKGACYGLLPTLTATVPGDGPVGILGTSKFVVPKQIIRARLHGDPAVASAHFAVFLAANEVIEPSAAEQQLAALLEAAAQEIALNLDTGESQLVAVLVSRCLPWLLTGDKRAIVSIEALLGRETRLIAVAGKIRCLEQLVLDALKTMGSAMRDAICAEPFVDKTLSICFGCSSPDPDPAEALEGLTSYIADLRRNALRALAT
jgi:hypothetical protein